MGKATRILLAMMMVLLTMGMAAPGYANDDDLDNYKFRIHWGLVVFATGGLLRAAE